MKEMAIIYSTKAFMNFYYTRCMEKVLIGFIGFILVSRQLFPAL
jgi:hypothetical protein